MSKALAGACEQVEELRMTGRVWCKAYCMFWDTLIRVFMEMGCFIASASPQSILLVGACVV